ncbi:hypothetical protein RRG08_019478 [Elysia crispata]|uniref:Uncharacterized protein n=1 Tax=Elysia crispata TaxID=231223 RepID=A0AAE1A917_9GAST|nr:hypothetical protein RRG08_019478 [Elysia crispata]
MADSKHVSHSLNKSFRSLNIPTVLTGAAASVDLLFPNSVSKTAEGRRDPVTGYRRVHFYLMGIPSSGPRNETVKQYTIGCNPTVKTTGLRQLPSNPTIKTTGLRQLPSNPTVKTTGLRQLPSNPTIKTTGLRQLPSNPTVKTTGLRQLPSNPTVKTTGLRQLPSNPTVKTTGLRQLPSNPTIKTTGLRQLPSNPTIKTTGLRQLPSNPTVKTTGLRQLPSNPTVKTTGLRQLPSNPTVKTTGLRQLPSNPTVKTTGLGQLPRNPTIKTTELRQLTSHARIKTDKLRLPSKATLKTTKLRLNSLGMQPLKPLSSDCNALNLQSEHESLYLGEGITERIKIPGGQGSGRRQFHELHPFINSLDLEPYFSQPKFGPQSMASVGFTWLQLASVGFRRGFPSPADILHTPREMTQAPVRHIYGLFWSMLVRHGSTSTPASGHYFTNSRILPTTTELPGE